MGFDRSFERVFTHEGRFQKNPTDRGNWTSGKVGRGTLKGTKFGISAMTYPHLDIINLTMQEAKSIYRRDWWEKLKMETFPISFRYQLFDAAINHGMGNATKMLQRATAQKADGFIGAQTQDAVRRTDKNDLLFLFLAERLEFMTHISTWHIYGKGWARRIALNLKFASYDN